MLSVISRDSLKTDEGHHDGGLDVADIERILNKLEDLTSLVSDLRSEMSEARAWQNAREENIQRFFSQDWAGLIRRVDVLEHKTLDQYERLSVRVREVEKRVWTFTGAAILLGAALSYFVRGIQQ